MTKTEINLKKDNKGIPGKFIRLQVIGQGQIGMTEIEIYGEKAPIANYKVGSNVGLYKPNITPFDPNSPNFGGAEGEYERTLKAAPMIVGVKNSDKSFDIAFQDTSSKLIKVNTYEKVGNEFKKNAASDSRDIKGLGVFGGFAKDADGNRYIFTGTPWTLRGEKGDSIVYKNNQELWKGQFYNKYPKTNEPNLGKIESFMHYAGSRLVIGNDSLLITTNIAPAHPYQVILDTKDTINKNKDRIFFESQFQHNFGQRAIFDGTDFVIMENRDHDVSVTLSKLKPSEVLPLVNKDFKPVADIPEIDQKRAGHDLEYVKRIFSVYSHTNMNNSTFTELGNVEKGFGDNGYLVLFSGERDWNFKMNGYNYANLAPNILSPRDIGLVHVKKDFDKTTSNWEFSMCPMKVDNSSVVNSTGAKTTVKYRAAEDGWDWANTYNSTGPCKLTLGKERVLETKGVKWITNYDPDYATSLKKKAADSENASKENVSKESANKEFTSVNHPKLVRIDKNKYVVLWEEWKADSAGYGNPKKQYLTTKAALITLEAAPNDEVNIKSTEVPKDLGKIRLMPGDDAFEFDGKAAWAVGDVTKGKLMFYTVDASLNLASYELEL